MSSFLPYGRQTIEADDLAAVAEALTSDYLTTGPRVEAFEAALCKATGAAHMVACSNGTAALHLASLALGIGPGDQVIVPSITFLATANAPRLCGAEIVFADVDPQSGLLTAETLSEALTRAPRAKAVFPVHLNGSWVNMPDVAAIARSRNLLVVEDSCHALGTTYRLEDGTEGQVGDGRFSDLATFSFHPVKAIAMGEGGAIAAQDPALAARMRLLRSHGMTRAPDDFENRELAFDRDNQPALWYYEMQAPGYNYRVPDLLCALGISQLAKLDRFVERRRALAFLYDKALAPLAPRVVSVHRPENARSAFHLYAALIDFEAIGCTRAAFVRRLHAEKIGTQVHYIPVHRQPYYAAQPEAVALPGADRYYSRVLSLPLFPTMADDDVVRVADAIARIAHYSPV